jgi:hypothetical protein
MEEERTSSTGMYDSDELAPDNCDRVGKILEKMVAEQRIAVRDFSFAKVM